MKQQESATSAGSSEQLSLSSNGDSASHAASEAGMPSRKKQKKYTLSKHLDLETVDRMCRLLGFSLEDFQEVKPKKKRAEGDPKPAPNNTAFFLFWSQYPRQDIIGAAMKAWRDLQPDAQTLEQILADVKARACSMDWRKDGGRWIPYAHIYLRDKRWLDKGIVNNNRIIVRRTVV